MLEVLRRAKRVGFVFSGGSARCVFQIGVIEALSELGVRPALTIGVSAGVWNAAIVSARVEKRIRWYWRSFVRMPHVRLRNLIGPEHSPWRFREVHERTFQRFIGSRLQDPDALPCFVSVTRVRDHANVIFEAGKLEDPMPLLIASNHLVPFYTHPPIIDGEAYADGASSDNAPYERAFAEGCDVVVLVSQKGESEGGVFKSVADGDHIIPPEYADRVVVIQPRHRMPLSFTERRWRTLEAIAHLGYLRTREVLLGEDYPETQIRARGEAPSARITRIVRGINRARAIIARQL